MCANQDASKSSNIITDTRCSHPPRVPQALRGEEIPDLAALGQVSSRSSLLLCWSDVSSEFSLSIGISPPPVKTETLPRWSFLIQTGYHGSLTPSDSSSKLTCRNHFANCDEVLLPHWITWSPCVARRITTSKQYGYYFVFLYTEI